MGAWLFECWQPAICAPYLPPGRNGCSNKPGSQPAAFVPPVLAENAVLTFFGSVLSLVITYWGHRFIISIFPQQVFRISDIELSPGIVAFVITSFALTVLIVSLVAARALPAQNAADLLKSASGNVIGSLKIRRVLNVLVVCELALAVVLLVEAGLMIRSFWALRYRDLGFGRSKFSL